MIEIAPIISEIQGKMEEISLILMQHENKDFCLAKVHPNSWRQVSYRDNHKEYRFIMGQSENSVAILLSGYSFVSLRHETMASITDSIS